jgi:hypothetical protein
VSIMVVVTSLWPQSSWMVRISQPASSTCVTKEALHPGAVRLVGPAAVAAGPQGFGEAIEELRLSGRRTGIRLGRVCALGRTGLRSRRGVPRTQNGPLGPSVSQGAERSRSRRLRRVQVIRLMILRRPHPIDLPWRFRRAVGTT